MQVGGQIMLFMAFLQPLQTSQLIVAGALRGAGDTWATAVIAFVTVLIFRPFAAIILVHMGYGLYGAWIALACDQMIRSALMLARYRGEKWKSFEIG